MRAAEADEPAGGVPNVEERADKVVEGVADLDTEPLGLSQERSRRPERLARRSAQNVEVITKYGTVLAEAAQDSSR